MGKVVDLVTELAIPIVEKENLELVDVEYVKEGGTYYLRIFIDSEEGVGLKECEAVSNILDKKLDELDPIKESYILEVSSPGLERPLKKIEDFDRFKGRLVFVKTYAPVDGRKEITGYIKGRNDEKICLRLKDNNEEIEILYSDIAKARLAIDF